MRAGLALALVLILASPASAVTSVGAPGRAATRNGSLGSDGGPSPKRLEAATVTRYSVPRASDGRTALRGSVELVTRAVTESPPPVGVAVSR